MFLNRNKKNNVYPCKPQFYYIKVGFKGVKIISVCFRDADQYITQTMVNFHCEIWEFFTTSWSVNISRSIIKSTTKIFRSRNPLEIVGLPMGNFKRTTSLTHLSRFEMNSKSNKLLFLNQRKGENDCRKYFMIILHEKKLPHSGDRIRNLLIVKYGK